MLGFKIKRPVDVLDYELSYEDWLTDDDMITTVTTSVLPVGELVVDSVQVSSPNVKTWVSGGISGSTYEIEVTAATTGGRIKKECFKIRIRDC